MDCTPENVQHVLNVANFQRYVDERVSMDDVARTKESPESFKSLSDEEGRKQYDKQQKEAGIYTDLTVYESKM